MAVTKIWAIHDSVSRVVDYCTNPSKTKLSDLEQVLLYAADKGKTLDEGEQQYAVTGIGCRAESAAREMAAVQRRFGKAGGNVAYHAYQSFKTGEVTAEECHRIGVETARRLWGNDRQVLVATHFNTGTYHNHFVVNPVNMWTGKKLEAKYEVYYKLRDMSDRICKEHGLSVVKNPQRHKTARSVYFAEKNGEPTRYNLMRRALDEALTMSSSWTELSAVLRKKGYVFVCDPYRRYATLRSLSSKKCMRTFRLGAEYDKEALQDRLLENQRDIRVTRRYFEFMRPYLDTQAINPRYSASNVMLAMAQNPEITYINSLEVWNRLGRSVNRDENGMKIRVSDTYVKDGREYHGYKIGRVFDVTQTHGKAGVPALSLKDNTPEMDAALRRLLDSSPVPVVTSSTMYQDAVYDPKTQSITVSSRLIDSKIFAALSREIVHAGIHDHGRYPYYTREDCAMDAESVSYMLCRNFGVETPQPDVSRVGQVFDGMEVQDRRGVVDSLQKYFRKLQNDIQREISPQERKQPEQNRPVR